MATKKTDDQAQTQGAEVADTTAAVAVATLPAAAQAAPGGNVVDEFHGIGGEYEMVDGVRRLVSRTEVIDPSRA